MDIKLFLKRLSLAEREAFAKDVDCSAAYLNQLAGGHRTPSTKLTLQLCEASNWVMTPHEIRPLDYPNPLDGIPLGHQAHPMRRHDDRSKTA